jgi:hypothetical protein
MGAYKLDIRDVILNRDVENITKNNYDISLCGKMIIVDYGQVYFYENLYEALHDYEILERYVRLQNTDFD